MEKNNLWTIRVVISPQLMKDKKTDCTVNNSVKKFSYNIVFVQNSFLKFLKPNRITIIDQHVCFLN